MPTLGLLGKHTLLDWAKSLDPNGNTANVVELLNQSNEILTDMPFIEGNLPTGHKTTIRTGISLLRFTLHGHVRSFGNDDYDKAASWVAA